MDNNINLSAKFFLIGIFILISLIGGCMYGMPKYNVYHQQMEGEAELAKANFSKQTMIQEAHSI